MKKNVLKSIMVALIGALITSCGPIASFDEDLLIGKWQDDNNEQHYFVYTTESDETGSYQYGKEWDESEDVYESDLTPYGNGWFKWQLVQSDLTQLHLMDNHGAEIPKVYTVTHLDDSKLIYKDNFNKSYSFSKVR
ncbi:MAG: hypothetical protein NC038_02415 [Paludibacter sp.]|nr:hypothetical protein [Bacteroidales bacterium]MCM1068529.1 hypothetical protein [Prevotella sp.]MCM1353483.1 hypothetical protein [Bacteroides sp.]MCM1442644.1 hypothetical protein [Muribaculum sp.]MCM1481489.1 hypothetical protein [Paludibacter sp.]